MNREKRIYEMFFDKGVWLKRMSYVIFGLVIVPLSIGLITATKCEFQKYQIKSEEGIYGKT